MSLQFTAAIEAPNDANAYVDSDDDSDDERESSCPEITGCDWKIDISAQRKGRTIVSPGKGGKSSPAGPYLGT